ncbi:carbohydrate ABC transporter permease, partial [Bifidobacterium coryneforme]
MISMVGKSIRRWWALFTIPTLAAFVVGFVVPFVMGIWLSLCRFTTVTDASFIGLGNYSQALSDPEFWHSMLYTLAFTVVTTVIINVLGFAVAYMLTKAIRGANIFRSVFFMPNLIGGIILGYIWLLLLNGVLGRWGRSITYSGVYGFWGMVMLYCWQQIGYMMIIYIAGLQSLPGDVIEAASVDGANGRQRLFHITLPLMMPSITVCTFLTMTNGFKMFDQN